MPELLQDWYVFLDSGGAVFGLLLALAGGAFLMTGWRFGQSAVIMTYALVGATAGRMFGIDAVGGSTAVLGGAGIGVLLGYSLKDYSGPVLGGILGSLSLWSLLGNTTLPQPTVYIMLAMAFAAVAAFGVMNIRTTAIMLSSFTGAALLVSGSVAMALGSDTISPHFRSMSDVGIFYPFVIAIATFSGFFTQAAAANRKDCGEVGM